MGSLTIDINAECNLDCVFCYQDKDGSRLEKNKVMGLVETNQDMENVLLGGGEPFFHPEIIEILEGLIAADKDIHISTNGTIMLEEMLELPENEREKIRIQVSLHASDPCLYEKITGKDMFMKVIDNAKLYDQYFETVFSCSVYQDNYHDVENIAELACELGIPIRFILVFPVGNGTDVNLVREDQMEDLKGIIAKYKIISKGLVDSPILHHSQCPCMNKYYGFKGETECPAYMGQKIYVGPRGRTKLCEFL